MSDGRLNLEKPRYDQSHFWGRFRHFFDVTNPRNCLATDEHLENAATLLQQYKYVTRTLSPFSVRSYCGICRRGEEPRGTTNDQVWHAKILYESAFHPDTGEKQVKTYTVSTYCIGREDGQHFNVYGSQICIHACSVDSYRSGSSIFSCVVCVSKAMQHAAQNKSKFCTVLQA